ncbi:MAG: hypothetical protein OEX82_06045 [Nitrosomonas sp.]|nr:hypothetical protein [Nitrosomonas sp.]
MKILFALLFGFSVNNFANASDFELTVYFNLSASEKHGLVRCRPGGNKLKAEYHLIVIKDQPKYTVIGNLDLNKDVLGAVEGNSYCNEGEFTLRKLINNSEESINLSILLVETYLIKDSIFDIEKVELPPNEDYFIESKFINVTGQIIVEKGKLDEIVNSDNAINSVDNSDILYRIEIRR